MSFTYSNKDTFTFLLPVTVVSNVKNDGSNLSTVRLRNFESILKSSVWLMLLEAPAPEATNTVYGGMTSSSATTPELSTVTRSRHYCLSNLFHRKPLSYLLSKLVAYNTIEMTTPIYGWRGGLGPKTKQHITLHRHVGVLYGQSQDIGEELLDLSP
jgi:hypothetical protein